MGQILPVFAILAWVVMFFSGSMLVPLGVAWFGDEPAASRHAYGGAVLVTLLSGAALWAMSRRTRRELQPRDGVLLVVLTWTCLLYTSPSPRD